MDLAEAVDVAKAVVEAAERATAAEPAERATAAEPAEGVLGAAAAAAEPAEAVVGSVEEVAILLKNIACRRILLVWLAWGSESLGKRKPGKAKACESESGVSLPYYCVVSHVPYDHCSQESRERSEREPLVYMYPTYIHTLYFCMDFSIPP